MKLIGKHFVEFFTLAVICLCSACTGSTTIEDAVQLPKEPLFTSEVLATLTTTPVETLATIDTVTPIVTNTSEPTLTPPATNTPIPTSTPTLEPTSTPFSDLSPFTFEQLLNRVQFPILADAPGIYTLVVIQEHSIQIIDDTEIEGPFGYVNPAIVGIGWVNLPNGSAQRVAYLTAGYIQKAVTFSDTGVVDTDTSGLYFSGHVFHSRPDLFTDYVPKIQFFTEQEYYLRRRSDVDVATGLPIHTYDNWEAADWSRDDSIYRPRNGFGDEWFITIGLPGNSLFPAGSTKDDIDETYGGGDIGHMVLGPWVNSFAEYSPSILTFVQSGDVSGLPTVIIDGQVFPLLPGYRAHWFHDRTEEDYQ